MRLKRILAMCIMYGKCSEVGVFTEVVHFSLLIKAADGSTKVDELLLAEVQLVLHGNDLCGREGRGICCMYICEMICS